MDISVVSTAWLLVLIITLRMEFLGHMITMFNFLRYYPAVFQSGYIISGQISYQIPTSSISAFFFIFPALVWPYLENTFRTYSYLFIYNILSMWKYLKFISTR